MKLHINYTKDGEKHSDFEAEDIVNAALARIINTDQEVEILTTNANVVYAARVLTKEKTLAKHEVVFYFEGEVVPHDVNGEFKEYPKGFLDISTNLLFRLI